MILERSQELLVEQMVLAGVVQIDQLLEPIERLLARNNEEIAQFDRMIDALRDLHPTSRLASGYERLRCAYERVNVAAESIKAISQPGELAAAVLQQVHALQAGIDFKLATYLDDEEFDPELVALADLALQRIGEDSKATAAK
jgi:hypothetical protein